MSKFASISGTTSKLPKAEQMMAWSQDDVQTFLRENRTRLNLEYADIDKIYNEKIDGEAFLALTQDDLTKLGIVLGPVKKVMNLINDIRGKPSIKRKKHDTDDQKLERFWRALKNGEIMENKNGEFLKLPEDGNYLLDQDEQGSNTNEPNKPSLFVRRCYHDLYEMIFNNVKVRRWRISGNPGIGKTFFCFYLLYHLARTNQTVIYHRLKKPSILFSDDDVYSYPEDNIHVFKDFLANKKVWYIVDGREPMDYVAKTILFCSPQKHYYDAYDKLNVAIRYMPVWTWKEVDNCRNELFSHLNQEYVWELYKKWGEIPQFTLFYAQSDEQQALLKMAINAVNENLLDFVGETTEDNNSSHRIVHIRPNVPEVGR
ncbi:crinkler (CRN) family protein, putative [Rhizophagus clarus]|uniref:Crinkler (CRN) family protein, putative n=1 Tax=Rhizophagus clarus TaxID=94130 RepID=A0A8H3KR92_9GLOM|nr:crinkler (CRN) family protein, putative [Rhizophagus clarus]